MEIRLEWLKAFRAIMQTGTVTGATTIIFRTQPQVSRMIAGLEASLGFHLFKREGRRLIPTAEGLRFYTHIEPLLANFDRLNSIAEDIKEKRGKPLVVAAESFSLHCLVPEAVDTMYRASGTQFAIDLCVREMGLWVSRSNVDLAVVALPFTQTDLEQFSFAQAELVATLPANHPLARQEVIELTALASEPFIALRPATLLRSQIDLAAVRSGRPFRPIMETASGVTACELVARGLGVSISDPILARSFRQKGVVVRKLSTPLHVTYGFLLNPAAASLQVSQIVQHVIEAAKRLGGAFVTIVDSMPERMMSTLHATAADRPGHANGGS